MQKGHERTCTSLFTRCIFCAEARLGSCSQMHQQEEFGQIPDPFGQRDQDIKGIYLFVTIKEYTT